MATADAAERAARKATPAAGVGYGSIRSTPVKPKPRPRPKPKPVAKPATRPAAVQPIAVAPAPAPAAVAPKPESQFDLEEIQAALNSITAGFNIQEGQLGSEQSDLGRAFQFLLQRLNEARGQALESTQSVAAGRGLLRSGLYLNRVGEVSEDFAEERSQAQADRDARLRGIAAELGGLTQQEKAQRAARARELLRQQLATKDEAAQVLRLV